MAKNSMKMRTLVLWASVWALAMIASAILFKGSPVKEWLQSALYVGAIVWWLCQSAHLTRHRC